MWSGLKWHLLAVFAVLALCLLLSEATGTEIDVQGNGLQLQGSYADASSPLQQVTTAADKKSKMSEMLARKARSEVRYGGRKSEGLSSTLLSRSRYV